MKRSVFYNSGICKLGAFMAQDGYLPQPNLPVKTTLLVDKGIAQNEI
jgi:hypothetical protein